jgi:hypothetical protein
MLLPGPNGSIERVDHGTAALIDLWAGKMVRHLGDVIVDGVRATPGPGPGASHIDVVRNET